MRGDDDRAHAERDRAFVILAHAVAGEQGALRGDTDRAQRRLVNLGGRLAPADLAREDHAIDERRDAVRLQLAPHHLRRKRGVGAHTPLDASLAEPRQDAEGVGVDLHGAVPALLLGVEDLVQQGVREAQSGPPPRLAVHVHVVDLVLAHAADVLLERKQHLVEDRLRLRGRHSKRRLDPGSKLAQHAQKVIGGIGEGDERAAVVEQDAFDVGHGHILMPVAKRLTHLDDKGAARMVDVADKLATTREATAECIVRMAPETVTAVREGTAKGDALQVARVAGIMAAKRTPELIPLCHPLPLSSVSVDFDFVAGGVRVEARVRVVGQTGVEMEALTAAAVAGLTLVDMTKGVERGVYLENVRLLEKSGGRSGTWKRPT